MAKKGMARPDWTHTKPRNEVSPVPEIQGKAKSGKDKAKPIIAGTSGAEQKVYHTESSSPKRTGSWTTTWPVITWKMTSRLRIWKTSK